MRYESARGPALKSELLLADAPHTRSDVLTSCAVLVSLAGVWLGYPMLDPIGGLVIAVFIAHTGYPDRPRDVRRPRGPRRLDADDIRRVVMGVPEVKGCHHIRTRGSADHTFLDLHVWFPADMTLDEAHRLSHVVKDRLMAQYPHIADAIIHIEPPPAADERQRGRSTLANCGKLRGLPLTTSSPLSFPQTSRYDPCERRPYTVRQIVVSSYRSSITLRFTLSVGVSSPDSIENSRGRSANFLMRSNWDRSRLRPSTISLIERQHVGPRDERLRRAGAAGLGGASAGARARRSPAR